jgi:hypothetical protein
MAALLSLGDPLRIPLPHHLLGTPRYIHHLHRYTSLRGLFSFSPHIRPPRALCFLRGPAHIATTHTLPTTHRLMPPGMRRHRVDVRRPQIRCCRTARPPGSVGRARQRDRVGLLDGLRAPRILPEGHEEPSSPV